MLASGNATWQCAGAGLFDEVRQRTARGASCACGDFVSHPSVVCTLPETNAFCFEVPGCHVVILQGIMEQKENNKDVVSIYSNVNQSRRGSLALGFFNVAGLLTISLLRSRT